MAYPSLRVPREEAEKKFRRLERGELAKIEDGRGLLVKVISGALWMTAEGCQDDYIIRSGFPFLLRNGENVVLQGLDSTLFELSRETDS